MFIKGAWQQKLFIQYIFYSLNNAILLITMGAMQCFLAGLLNHC